MTTERADTSSAASAALLAGAVEALLFAAESPLGVDTIRACIEEADERPTAARDVEAALDELRARYESADGGIQLVAVGDGFELRTRAAFAPYVHRLYRNPPVRLSRASLEVLAIIAYRQPCTRADIEDIRGVDCARMLRTLLERALVRILGKADDVGRPLLYGTTTGFLQFFGLTSLSELPTLKEYAELSQEHVVELQALEETLRANAHSNGTQLTLDLTRSADALSAAPPSPEHPHE